MPVAARGVHPLRAMSFGLKRSLLLLILLSWCGAMIAMRTHRAGPWEHFGFGWNLFLATVPAIIGSVIVAIDRRGRSLAIIGLLAVVWLLFLPNAPYLVTDLLYVRHRPPIPLWFDVAMLASFASTGLLLGYTSVADVQLVVTRRFGQATGWITSLVALALSAFGVYLGRFLRWNSWDAFSRPGRLASDVASRLGDPGPHPDPVTVTFVYGVGLIVGYVALHLVSSTTVRRQSDR